MVAILMSTYNGAHFLKEQIDSILGQTYTDFQLMIRDDGSSDDTCDLIRAYDDPRIQLFQENNLGPCGSFFSLVRKASDADYLFFSDQDDVWFPEKLETMLAQIRKYDACPAMVFSDFSMIDENGTQTHPSYAQYASLRVNPGSVGLEQLIAQPYVFGCAAVINRKLADMVQNPPEGVEMHDCWISLTAASVGKLIYLPQQTIAHRFHSSNATGRKDQTHPVERVKRLFSGFSAQSNNTALRLHQVNLLLQCYEGLLLPQANTLLKDISAAMARGHVSTVLKLKELGIGRQKAINTLFFYLTVFGIKGDIQ